MTRSPHLRTLRGVDAVALPDGLAHACEDLLGLGAHEGEVVELTGRIEAEELVAGEEGDDRRGVAGAGGIKEALGEGVFGGRCDVDDDDGVFVREIGICARGVEGDAKPSAWRAAA